MSILIGVLAALVIHLCGATIEQSIWVGLIAAISHLTARALRRKQAEHAQRHRHP